MSPLYNSCTYFQIDFNIINPAAILLQVPSKEIEQPHEVGLHFAKGENGDDDNDDE